MLTQKHFIHALRLASYSSLHWEATILSDHHSGVSCRAVPDQGNGSPLNVFVANAQTETPAALSKPFKNGHEQLKA